ncbi:MAG: hypothetical protein JSV19_03875, partial [Phycisphaerales bacterium]
MPAPSETILDPLDPELLAGNVDFYCRSCGYNLRGLTGDPKRCPECFCLNPVSDLLVPAEAITRQLRKLEIAPVACVAAIVMLATGIAGATLLAGQGGLCCLAAMLVPAPSVWLLGADSFGRSCRHTAGWKIALARFDVYGLLVFTTGIGIPLSLFWIVMSYVYGRWPGGLGKALLLAALVSSVSFAVLYPTAVRPLYRKAKTGFKDLQQQTAVELARELHRADVRRRLRRA